MFCRQTPAHNRPGGQGQQTSANELEPFKITAWFKPLPPGWGEGSSTPLSPGSVSVLSDVMAPGTGAPQGADLPPFLFTLYTTDLQASLSHLFPDDSAIVGCLRGGGGLGLQGMYLWSGLDTLT